MSSVPPLFDLSGRVALITGSSQGLGFELARGLARHGAAVVVNGRNEARVNAAVALLRGEGLRAHGAVFDITNGESVAKAAAEIQEAAGPIDILVNNAGVQRRGPLEQITEAQWREVLDINLTGAFLVARAIVPGMIARGGGKIINICSLMSAATRPTTGPYTAAKGGLKLLTASMAVEWGKHNVQANAIGPGYFATEMTRPLVENAAFNAWVCQRTPAGRWGRPEELVGAAVFLASRASDYVSGQILYVDGGMLAAL